MIFGFNTDVKHGNTVYHVQSEARERELRLQTQVFVSGRCVAKRGTSYAEHHARPDFSTEQMHDLLRDQHREIIELVRNGQLEKVGENASASSESAGHGAAAESPSDEEPGDLDLNWLNPGEFTANTDAPLQIQVLKAGIALSGVRVTVRVNGNVGAPHYAQGVTATNGCATVPVFLEASGHGDTVAMLVQATSGGALGHAQVSTAPLVVVHSSS